MEATLVLGGAARRAVPGVDARPVAVIQSVLTQKLGHADNFRGYMDS